MLKNILGKKLKERGEPVKISNNCNIIYIYNYIHHNKYKC